VLVHLVDLSAPGEDRAPLRDLDVLDHELARYSPELAMKPQIVAANKIDLPEARERLPGFQAALAKRGMPVFPISAATGEGVAPLLDAVAQVLSGGALPALGRAERPRRRPKAGAASAGNAGSKEGRRPQKKSTRTRATRSAAGRRGASTAPRGAGKGARSPRKGTR
jgi:GTP-binding protein